MLFPGVQVALRTAENKTNSVYICTPGQNSRWGALCGQVQKYPKKERNGQKKIITQFRRGSKCHTQHQSRHKYRVRSSSGDPTEDAEQLSGAGDKEWHKEQEQQSQCCPCPALASSQLFSPWRNAQALGWAQMVLAKPGLGFDPWLCLSLELDPMIQPRIFCELHEGKLPGRDGVTISGSVQEGSGCGCDHGFGVTMALLGWCLDRRILKVSSRLGDPMLRSGHQ